MAGTLILASKQGADREFAGFVGFANDMEVREVRTPAELRSAAYAYPESALLWDAAGQIAMAPAIREVLPPSRVFAVTPDSLAHHPGVMGMAGCFSHHFYRRFENPAPTLYARLIRAVLGVDAQGRPRRDEDASLVGRAFGLEGYFPEGAHLQRISIKRSGQKAAAVEAIQNVFVKQKVNSRIAALAAQAADELIMNAVFDAPTLPSGVPMRRGTPRDLDFELVGREVVRVELASNDEYAGLCVADEFGSLRKETLMKFLGQDFHGQAYDPRQAEARSGAGAGLGLHGIHQAGLSLVFACG
jgi:hypothetical protein